MDIAKQLQAYEVEYHVLQDELIDSSLNDNQRLDKLEKANSSLRKQNFELLEELQVQFIFIFLFIYIFFFRRDHSTLRHGRDWCLV